MKLGLLREEGRAQEGREGKGEALGRSLLSIKCPATLRTLEPKILEPSKKGIQGMGCVSRRRGAEERTSQCPRASGPATPGFLLTLVSWTPQTLDPEASASYPYSFPLSLLSALLIPQALKDGITLEL